ncbi:ABC transporter ATP-binding protein [Facklamia miroungae]|uniref:ABC-2 type transport system ATP-binding protein n=1 Tax=Facklamia miroungae TaxID=120956 RepID=A0A1G7Q8H7_9LACT|nr:ABC transporter ATP-binding protein [Facklamia miroungae]NKZ28857.1 ABC transporter ATP-binding protein [Facklamia miroungae]SDF94783.1 ABC-2 type transport system ATP-binding protein [Facklamia miroungae]
MIKLENLNKSYKDSHILKGVTLEVNDGEIYGLIGKNGAGKTTIFKMILGLSKLDSGKLIINESRTRKELIESRKKIGFFIGLNFFGYLNAEANLKYYCQLKGITNKGEVDRVLKIVGLDGNNKAYKSFSMGMKQRLGIANALLGNPETLILDEPTNGLDPQGIANIRNLIKQLNEEHKMTIIVSSHNLSELENTANRFGIVHNGKILKELTREDLSENKDRVEIRVEDLERAKKVLLENNIELLEASIKATSLENYYFRLVDREDD